MSSPLYVRIQQYIRLKIESGEWKTGDQIPPESELGVQFGCSRITVTTALRELAKEGLIYRVQGKGSFVAEPPAAANYYDETPRDRLSVSTNQLRLPGDHKCIGVYEEVADQKVADILQLKPGQKVIRMVQIKYIDGIASFVEKSYLPQSLFASIPLDEMRELSITEMASRCEILLDKSYISSEPLICDAEIALLLGIQEGSAIMQFCIEMHDAQGKPVCCEYAYSKGKQEKTLMT